MAGSGCKLRWEYGRRSRNHRPAQHLGTTILLFGRKSKQSITHSQLRILEDASIDFIDEQTILEFTTTTNFFQTRELESAARELEIAARDISEAKEEPANYAIDDLQEFS